MDAPDQDPPAELDVRQSTSSPMILFRRYAYDYPGGPYPSLGPVTLDIPRGALALVAGPSGVGKSTLLRATNGLVPRLAGGHVSGLVRVSGRDPVRAGLAVMSGIVGFVPGEHEAGFVADTVEEEVAFALEHRGLCRSEMEHRIGDALERVQLSAVRHRDLESLSGGERQRVAIASALALRPAVLVLDEPTSQLDDDAAESVLDAIVELARQTDLTVIVSEHRLERVVPFASHLVYMAAPGSAPIVGPPRMVLPHVPRHRVPPPPNLVPGEEVLALEGVGFRYDGTPVLADAAVEVRQGEVVALTGPSGSGKTTLLRLAVGLLQPNAGRVRVAGEPIAGKTVAEICRKAGFLPQDPGLLLYADSVRQELTTTLDNHGLPATGPTDPDRLLERLGIADQAARYPRDLSTGQRQRVALGAVAVTNPSVLLLDEPTRGLDDAAIVSLASLLHASAAAGAGVLVATHDSRLTAGAHRVLHLRNGRVAP